MQDQPFIEKTTFFRHLAKLSILLSASCLMILVAGSFHLAHQAEQLRRNTAFQSIEYLTKTETLWTHMIAARKQIGRTALRFSRSYDPFKEMLNKCNGCVRLNCPPGSIGPIGEPGADGTPGLNGEQGALGDDGLNIILGPLPDLPCVICPAGPPGPRGETGERGWPGEPGTKGIAGPPGQPGPNGWMGHVGAAGKPGQDGQPGLPGLPGDSIVAGVGEKGPRGAPGRSGFVGPVGIPGRPSNILGRPGTQGPVGPSGPPGDRGTPGSPGIVGAPGEIGAIQPFCMADCSQNKARSAQAAMLGVTLQQFAFPLAFAPPGDASAAKASQDDYYDGANEPLNDVNDR